MRILVFFKGIVDKLLQRDYWHVEQCVGRNFSAEKLGGYYADLRAKTRPYEGPTSAEGVPLINLGREFTFVLHPVTVCQVALGWHEIWFEERSDNALVRFLRLADWLVSHQKVFREVEGVWPVPYHVSTYNLPADWCSALVQGQAVSVLVRAHKMTGIESYLHSAERALRSLWVNVDQGGVQAMDEDGRVFYEEYPSSPPSFVLNGYISALWGLYDFSLATGDSETHVAFLEGVDTLVYYLPKFDTGYWSLYSLYPHRFPNVASPYYHRQHVAQLKATYLLTQHPELLNTALCWERYLYRRRNLVRTLFGKALVKISFKF